MRYALLYLFYDIWFPLLQVSYGLAERFNWNIWRGSSSLFERLMISGGPYDHNVFTKWWHEANWLTAGCVSEIFYKDKMILEMEHIDFWLLPILLEKMCFSDIFDKTGFSSDLALFRFYLTHVQAVILCLSIAVIAIINGNAMLYRFGTVMILKNYLHVDVDL